MKESRVEHPQQREILRKLSKAEGLRFSELKPNILENNVFMYHIHLLIRQGLIVKHDNGQYMLTIDGLRYVGHVTRGQLEHRTQPKLFSFLVLCNDQGEVVLHRRASQPFIGRYAFPGEVIYFGDSIIDHKERLLRDKVGIDVELSLRGLVDTQLKQADRVVSHVYAQILYGRVTGKPDVQSIDAHFMPEWINLSQIRHQNVLPDVSTIVDKVLGDEEYFYLSLANEG